MTAPLSFGLALLAPQSQLWNKSFEIGLGKKMQVEMGQGSRSVRNYLELVRGVIPRCRWGAAQNFLSF